MDDEMIDRCAKALWDADQAKPYVRYGFSNKILFGRDGPILWEEINTEDVVPAIAQDWRDKAILIFKAMREPTNIMHKAMCEAYNSPAAIWMAGIDAITND